MTNKEWELMVLSSKDIYYITAHTGFFCMDGFIYRLKWLMEKAEKCSSKEIKEQYTDEYEVRSLTIPLDGKHSRCVGKVYIALLYDYEHEEYVLEIGKKGCIIPYFVNHFRGGEWKGFDAIISRSRWGFTSDVRIFNNVIWEIRHALKVNFDNIVYVRKQPTYFKTLQLI